MAPGTSQNRISQNTWENELEALRREAMQYRDYQQRVLGEFPKERKESSFKTNEIKIKPIKI